MLKYKLIRFTLNKIKLDSVNVILRDCKNQLTGGRKHVMTRNDNIKISHLYKHKAKAKRRTN